MKLTIGNWYTFSYDGYRLTGKYFGEFEDYMCYIEGYLCTAHVFGVWYCTQSYETIGFAERNIPYDIKDIGKHTGIIVCK